MGENDYAVHGYPKVMYRDWSSTVLCSDVHRAFVTCEEHSGHDQWPNTMVSCILKDVSPKKTLRGYSALLNRGYLENRGPCLNPKFIGLRRECPVQEPVYRKRCRMNSILLLSQGGVLRIRYVPTERMRGAEVYLDC